MNKKFCDRCGIEIKDNTEKGVFENGFFMRFGDREMKDVADLCDMCIFTLKSILIFIKHI